jgi:hypothetical protein
MHWEEWSRPRAWLGADGRQFKCSGTHKTQMAPVEGMRRQWGPTMVRRLAPGWSGCQGTLQAAEEPGASWVS